jgi:hypothetical protein
MVYCVIEKLKAINGFNFRLPKSTYSCLVQAIITLVTLNVELVDHRFIVFIFYHYKKAYK